MEYDRFEDRNRSFQEALHLEKHRRKREAFVVDLRRKQRTELTEKRRALLQNTPNLLFDPDWVPQDLISLDPRLINPDLSEKSRISVFLSYLNCRDSRNRTNSLMCCLNILLKSNINFPFNELKLDLFVPFIQSALESRDRDLVIETLWSLGNITAGPSSINEVLVDKQVHERLKHNFLNANDFEIQDLALWNLNNIMHDFPHKVYELDISQAVLQLLLSPRLTVSFLSTLISHLSVCVRRIPEQELSVDFLHNILVSLPKFISIDEKDILLSCLNLVFYLTFDGIRIDCLFDYSIINRVIQLMEFPNEEVQEMSIKVIGNVSLGSEYYMKELVNLKILEQLLVYLQSESKTVIKESLFAIDNLCLLQENAEFVVNLPILKSIIDHLQSNSFEIKHEAIHCVNRFILSISDETLYRLSSGFLQALVGFCGTIDSVLLEIGLRGMERLLQRLKSYRPDGVNEDYWLLVLDEIGGINLIEGLQRHSNENVYNLAYEIIKNHIGGQEQIEVGIDQPETFDIS